MSTNAIRVENAKVKGSGRPPEQVADLKPRTGLLDLPPELWSKIGKLVIDDSPLITERSLETIQYWKTRKSYQPAIIRTCRSLRHELLPYLYRTRVLVMCGTSPADFSTVARWLHAMSSDMRRRVRGVRLSAVDIDLWSYAVNSKLKITFWREKNRTTVEMYELRFE
ncbi:hypothetical protein CLAFUW4_12865 [Fulvia fulva]|uniref:F-box domain-containing protein n=1 Tax=Passalora fulva TaxID=5499 RepID=A0A9Q8UV56_PASFU|nr:uncharacterized protein CLAFUR5_12731 [Fulvia fulva]KAK4611877.1 hypothetical protein CLAFUR4_12869 [Fulvia fulva]KAK4612947.1 hypothetical protein CLAFUR0_12875 [Fulvia fulva]UJO23560.1 hypothetical protein CLAFUR5_12731 [Fulvia fulva]WPV21188.1 hypothetical protein CLAFUW4_12865 [Fulvia fulva]WPV36472.1 hypothetical protein CLAFUW7_12872 [Fulvia fulva]